MIDLLLATLVRATPLLITGLAVAIAFRAGIWNIGAEGQLLAGAVMATWLGTHWVAARGPAVLVVFAAVLKTRSTTLAAEWRIAGRNTSRGCTIEALRLPIDTVSRHCSS